MTQLRTAPSRDSLTRASSKTSSVQVDLDSDLDAQFDPMRDVEDLTPLLDVPAKYSGTAAADRAERPMYSSTEDTDLLPRTPRHRRQPTSAARGRMLIAAMAVGAAAAASYGMATPDEEPTSRTVLAAEKTPIAGAAMAQKTSVSPS